MLLKQHDKKQGPKDVIESRTKSKDSFKKGVRLRWMDTFKAVQVQAIKADSFKAVREALDCFKAIGICLWVSKQSSWL